ncbi:hypothetical protein [Guptibacillus algicola]|uniref:hypothetical protein n=1 Tax=Guptibacillus algicola TaxID=225844 RepID=UPI001CD76223|nr:hypothetical protein [Alkalihalobacillus algicola]MCA0987126.1 hypothetical protein [Alkalihalobacillus algicola]
MNRYDRDDSPHKEPFNDAMDHLSKVEGYPTNRTSFRKLPKGIRYLGYFFIAFFCLMMVVVYFSQFFQ